MSYRKCFSATVIDEILDKSQELSKRHNYRNFSHYVEDALKDFNDKIDIKS